MNLIQIQDDLKMLPDQALQQQLLRPSGMVPSYLVMSELQRRKEMRNEYQSRPGPQRSMVEEFAQGMDNGPPQGPGQGLAQVPANPPPGPQQGGQQGIQPGQGQVGPSGLGMAGPPGGMTMPPQQPPMGFADGGEVSTRNWLNMQRANQEAMMRAMNPGYQPFYGGEFGVAPNQQYVDRSAPAMPQLERLRQMIAMAQRRNGQEPNNPGPVPGGNPILPPPNMPPQTVPEGPPAPPDDRTMLQRFHGAMANQSPDMSVMAADVIRSMPPIDWQGIGTGPDAQAQAQRYAEMMRISQDRPSLFQRDPDASLGETISRRIRGVPGPIPRQGPGGVQDYPPDVAPDPFANMDPGSFRGAGETGNVDQERPRTELRGEPPAWLKQTPFAAALTTPIEGADTVEFGGDRPPTGSPAVPPGGGSGVTRGLPPPTGGSAPVPVSGPPEGGPRPQGSMLANQGLDDIMAGMTQARGPDRYADLTAQNQQARADLLKGRDADRGMALLTAGLGMMAGQSPNALTNIGQGAMLGVRNWENASKEMRMAERDLRNADQAIAIAQANRDERAVEMAFKQKAMAEEALLRREDMAARRAASSAASGDAAANRALQLELKRQELEQNKFDREDRRALQREQTYNTQYNQAGQELLGWQKQRGSSGYMMMSDEEKKEIEAGIRNAQNRMRQAESGLFDFKVEQGIRTGVIKDARSLTEEQIMAKIQSGEWPSGTQIRTKRGVQGVP